MSLLPTQQQLDDFVTSDVDGEILMCNLLKFSDPQEYSRYAELVAELLEKVGGRILWAGAARHLLVGGQPDDWDAVALVTYPSRQAFLAMVADPGYQSALEHRDRGLARTALICCTQVPADGAMTAPEAG
ncbi:DUF1330 domain-containing protein [Streptomyces sp. NPDC047028]|uniref:DUF1330 domain-containing protein n=1 Tax=Streptomyces sp. NPDC047028 TaxID=3155793 RepID=UPI00340110D5